MNWDHSDTLKKGKHDGDGKHCLEFHYTFYLLKVETACKDKRNLTYRLISSNKRFLKKLIFFLDKQN